MMWRETQSQREERESGVGVGVDITHHPPLLEKKISFILLAYLLWACLNCYKILIWQRE